MTDRFVVRPDPEGFRVIDLLTGEAAVLAAARQSGLSRADADHTATMLNTRENAAREQAAPDHAPPARA